MPRTAKKEKVLEKDTSASKKKEGEKREERGKSAVEESVSKSPSKEEKGKEKKDKKKIMVFRNIKHLVLTEKAIDNINMKNTLVFIVDRRANKLSIKREVENAFGVKVEKVNTLIDRKGRKKAYIKLHADYSAIDVATQLGMM